MPARKCWIASAPWAPICCWYDPARNPQTELELGHLLFNYKLTVPLPFERGTFETEITGEYLANLKGTA